MKWFLFIWIVPLTVCGIAFAQDKSPADCPTIKVVTPEGAVRAGNTLKFRVEHDRKDLSDLKYEWSISPGNISRGQGTSEVWIDTNQWHATVREKITARVVVIGLPSKCPNVAEDYSVVFGIVDDFANDEFGRISLRDQKARIDAFLAWLVADPSNSGYILLRYPQASSKAELRKRVKTIKDHLFVHRGIARDRVVIVSESSDEEITKIWKVNKGKTFEICTNCQVH